MDGLKRSTEDEINKIGCWAGYSMRAGQDLTVPRLLAN